MCKPSLRKCEICMRAMTEKSETAEKTLMSGFDGTFIPASSRYVGDRSALARRQERYFAKYFRDTIFRFAPLHFTRARAVEFV